MCIRDSIYLNGTVLGFSPKYLDEKFDEIVEFSELQNFLDVPLKNLSLIHISLCPRGAGSRQTCYCGKAAGTNGGPDRRTGKSGTAQKGVPV